MSIAIITGASSGIGSQFARELKKTVGISEFWFIARRRERMEALRDELGVEARIISADLTEKEGINAVRDALAECRPSVKYLVNAAGFGTFGSVGELSVDDNMRMIDLNVKALVAITETVLPYMERGGRIIELGSASAFTPLPTFNVYASTKAFVLHYTKALNYEIKKWELRATCFCPCWVDTEFIGVATKKDDVSAPKSFKPLLNCERVVSGCVRASVKGRAMYVTNWFTKLQHVLSKLLPSALLTRMWLLLVKEKDDGKEES